ncbi:MAG: hypothetical protein KDA25_00105 [Phycisphaerales bacterium]|nr:hypothetical protein [Phycisphaerales bacterium]
MHTLNTFIAGAALAALFPLTAAAAPRSNDVAPQQALMSAFDLNRDGVLSDDEIDRVVRALHAIQQADDGMPDPDAGRRQGRRMNADAPVRGRAMRNRAEADAPETPRGMRSRRATHTLDESMDDEFTDEAPAPVAPRLAAAVRFEAMDLNGDGFLSPDEWMAHCDRMMAASGASDDGPVAPRRVARDGDGHAAGARGRRGGDRRLHILSPDEMPDAERLSPGSYARPEAGEIAPDELDGARQHKARTRSESAKDDSDS